MCSSRPGAKQPSAAACQTESINPSINPSDTPSVTTVHATDGAGGLSDSQKMGYNRAVDERHWYVVYTSPRAEKKACADLLRADYEAYCPTRMEMHTWSRGQRRKVEKVLIPGVVFVKVKSDQLNEIRLFPRTISFMMDPAKRHNQYGGMTFAVVPDQQMRLLKAMVGQVDYDVSFTSNFSLGEYVRVAGFDSCDELAQIVQLPGDRQPYVGVRVSFLGCAYMKVPTARIIKVNA